MTHHGKVIDTDAHFEIDPITRAIKNASSSKVTVIQYDHNSERFTFTLPKYIEEHDMLECNKVEVHYINVSADHKQQMSGVYIVEDLKQHESDADKVQCSWLLSQNVTLYDGAIQFLLRFSCIAEDGVTVEYAWNSGIYKGISVSKGIYNASTIIEQYADVLEQWKRDLILNLELDHFIKDTDGALLHKGRVASFADVPEDKEHLYSVGGKIAKVTGLLLDLFEYEEGTGYQMTPFFLSEYADYIDDEYFKTAYLYNPDGSFVAAAYAEVAGGTPYEKLKQLYSPNNPDSDRDRIVEFYVSPTEIDFKDSGVAFWDGEQHVKLPSEERVAGLEFSVGNVNDALAEIIKLQESLIGGDA